MLLSIHDVWIALDCIAGICCMEYIVFCVCSIVLLVLSRFVKVIALLAVSFSDAIAQRAVVGKSIHWSDARRSTPDLSRMI